MDLELLKPILVFKRQIQAYFYPLTIFHLFGFPSRKSSVPKIIGIKTYLFENFSQKKRLPKTLGALLRVKSVNYTIQMFENLRRSSMFRKFSISNRPPNRYFPKTDVGCPCILASPYTMNRPKRFICFSLIIELSFLH